MYPIQWAKSTSGDILRTSYIVGKELTLQTHHIDEFYHRGVKGLKSF